MRTTGKKLIAAVLALLMVVCALPAAAFAATTITSVSVTGFDLPMLGAVQDDWPGTLAVAEGGGYEITWTRWYDVTADDFMSDGDRFVAGNVYSLMINLAAVDGYVFAQDVEILVNNGEAELDTNTWSVSPDGSSLGFYTADIELGAVEAVDLIGYTEPTTKMMAYQLIEAYSLPDGAYYTFGENSYCYDVTAAKQLDSADYFEKGHEYYAVIEIVPAPGYTFLADTTATIDGGEENMEGYDCDGPRSILVQTKSAAAKDVVDICWYLDPNDDLPVTGIEHEKGTAYDGPPAPGKENFIFGGWYTEKTLENKWTPGSVVNDDLSLYPSWLKPVGSISITGYAAPVIGGYAWDSVKAVTVPYSSTQYELVSMSWHVDNTNMWLSNTVGYFEGGNTYSLVIELAPRKGYCFSDNSVIKLNGGTSLIDASRSGYNASTGHYIIWSKPTGLVLPTQPITAAGILGVEQPTVGLKVADSVAKVKLPDGANYVLTTYIEDSETLPAVAWYEEDGTLIRNSKQFEEGKKYYLRATVAPKTGYTLSAATSITVNGATALLDRQKSVYDPVTGYWHIYTTAFETAPHPDIPVTRLSGKTRTETAVKISQGVFCEQNGLTTSDWVIIASGDNYADALAGVPLSGKYQAPILLVQKAKGLDTATADEIKRLKAKNAVILGGTGAIPAEIEDQLKEAGCTNITRIKGATRYETAVKIAEDLYEGEDYDPSEVFFVYGENYPDALAVSSIAAWLYAPILYINKAGEPDAKTKEYLEGFTDKPDIIIIGGTGAISENAEMYLNGYSAEGAIRFSGKDRYATALKINDVFGDMFNKDCLCVATGLSFPDALAGGVFCSCYAAPLVLVPKDSDKDGIEQQLNYIKSFDPKEIVIFGGEAAVSGRIEGYLAKAH